MNNSDIWLWDVHPSDLPVFFEQQLDLDAIRMAAFPARDKDALAAHWEEVPPTAPSRRRRYCSRVAWPVTS